MNLGCVTDKGNYRQKNQDRIFCNKKCVEGHSLGIACVCDGIGSMPFSEVASEMMIEGIADWLDGVVKYYPEIMNTEAMVEDLEITIRELNDLICEHKESKQIEIGCTMSLICVTDCEYFIFHVGDSRIYSVEDKLVQLTQDEIVVRQVNGREKSYLMNYIGKNKQLRLYRTKGNVTAGAVYVIGSDGLYKKMRYEDVMQLFRISSDEEAERISGKLIALMLARGEKDNISCAVLKV